MSNTPDNDNPIDALLQGIDDGFKWVREQTENIIANNPQAYVDSIKLFFTISKVISEAYEPIVLQNAKKYAMGLREQKKMYDSAIQYFPFNKNSFMNAIYDINIRKYDNLT